MNLKVLLISILTAMLVLISSCSDTADQIGATVSPKTTYSCLSKNLDKQCESVSGTRCYYTDAFLTRRYYSCPEAWVLKDSVPGKTEINCNGQLFCYGDGYCKSRGDLRCPLIKE